jgi:aminoglycoside 6'-N-acetyltransferase
MLSHPEVAPWWLGTRGLDGTVTDLFSPDEHDAMFAIELDGEVVGCIQYSEEPDPDYRSAGIDILVAGEWLGRGLGSDALRTLARYLFEERGHHRLTIDPAAANERAIRAYRRVGFRPVGVMRAYERGTDGTWHDGLLMDLLPEDITE